MKMRSIADLVAGTAVFAGLDAATLDAVAGCGRNVHFDASETIVQAGAPAEHFWILRRGRVDISISAMPSETTTITRLGPGDLLGASWVAAPYRVVFDASAVEPTDAVEFDASCLRARCEEDHTLGFVLYRNVAAVMRNRLHAARMQLLDLCDARDG